ncbi:MAG TPA: hypothetical protein PLT86_05820 [Candidatus Latescibacteria bacterium]|nr:hypothetical protein [Candidatus Latescibacterota bacterium]
MTGQVDTPGTEGPYPLMVLIPGGSLSRRGTSSQFPAMSRLYDPLVDAALREGWAVFRYDRHETPPGSRDESQDIIDAIRAARALPDVDTRRIVLCAHASGTVFLQQAYDRVEEIVGFRSLRGVILLSNRADASEAGRMAGHLLVVVGESASTDEKRAGENAVRAHRESYPRWNARYLMVPTRTWPSAIRPPPAGGAGKDCRVPAAFRRKSREQYRSFCVRRPLPRSEKTSRVLPGGEFSGTLNPLYFC